MSVAEDELTVLVGETRPALVNQAVVATAEEDEVVAAATRDPGRWVVWIDRTDRIDEYGGVYLQRWSLVMALTAESGLEERAALAGMLEDVAGHLSPAHVAALIAHPQAVRSALAAAADVLTGNRERRHRVETVAGPAPTIVNEAEANRRLSARSHDDASEVLLSSDELAEQAGLKTRQSVHEWRRKGRIVGWQNARRGYVFPAGQLDGRNRPMPGLEGVAELFDDGYAAWVWLTTPLPSLDGATPLALLAQGQAGRVTDAARGDRQGDFG